MSHVVEKQNVELLCDLLYFPKKIPSNTVAAIKTQNNISDLIPHPTFDELVDNAITVGPSLLQYQGLTTSEDTRTN
jgi:hypothetical protein